MAWSNEEISEWQKQNNKMLAEINATLTPPDKSKPNIGIFAFGQNGDAMTCTSVLKYKDELWPDKNIIWFCNYPVADVLKYSKEVNEIRMWPWANNGLPEGSEDYWPMLTTENNRLHQALKLNYKDTEDIEEGYFPCPFMLSPQKRHGLDYPNCSRKVFGVPTDYPWHPMIYFSDTERHKADVFILKILNEQKQKIIFFETFAGSSQSILSADMINYAMKLCKERWGECTFIFPSHKFLRNEENFPEGFFTSNVVSCSEFTVRQCALIAEQCDLMISVSSGITVAASAWNVKQPPTIQFCGSWTCSTASLSNATDFELVTADNKLLPLAQAEFNLRLEGLLNKHK